MRDSRNYTHCFPGYKKDGDPVLASSVSEQIDAKDKHFTVFGYVVVVRAKEEEFDCGGVVLFTLCRQLFAHIQSYYGVAQSAVNSCHVWRRGSALANKRGIPLLPLSQ